MAQNGDIFWVHLIRVISVICVVLLHSAAQVLQLDVTYGSTDWWIANVIDSATRMCVPLLFMLTGFLLLNKSETITLFFRKRLIKVVVPLVAWTGIYASWLVLVERHNPSPISPLSIEISENLLTNFPVSLFRFLFGPAYYHLWFLYTLIGLYFCIPLLRVLVQNAERQLLWYFIIAWGVASVIFPVVVQAKVLLSIELGMVTGNIGYLLLGYLLGTITITKKLFFWMLPLYVVSVIITAVGTWWLSTTDVLSFFFYTAGPAIPTMAVSSYLILRYLIECQSGSQLSWFKRATIQLSHCTFGIYLVHALFLYAFHKGMFGFTLDAVQGSAILYIPLTAVAVYLSSYLVVVLFRQVPLIKVIVP
ncbi:acyltransferase [Aliikangiella coralliicola]|uniref:Acyltransferase family protein n=1 Tax=Aliikangiella coralliicola TaxID=2592383 RepID=A0A545UE76_9GAMM|nr:acyltransferase family protein [Aliikangiella coralliicola]TQV87784.1 acyltransferase family protein [Aliikangiella coralliicola]